MSCGYKGWFASIGGGPTVQLPEYDQMWLSASDCAPEFAARVEEAGSIPNTDITSHHAYQILVQSGGTEELFTQFPVPQNADISSVANLKLKIKPVFYPTAGASGSSQNFVVKAQALGPSDSANTTAFGADMVRDVIARSQYNLIMGANGNNDAAWAIDNINNWDNSIESQMIRIFIEKQTPITWNTNLYFVGMYVQWATDWTRVTEWAV